MKLNRSLAEVHRVIALDEHSQGIIPLSLVNGHDGKTLNRALNETETDEQEEQSATY